MALFGDSVEKVTSDDQMKLTSCSSISQARLYAIVSCALVDGTTGYLQACEILKQKIITWCQRSRT